MYKILYIDEYQEDIEHFKDYFDDKDINNKFEIKCLFPEQTLSSMYSKIFEEKPDAVISDYMLNEYKTDISYNIPYNGVDLTEMILQIKDKFPCFVLTSHDDKAIKTSQDVNMVYIKGILHGSEERTNAKANFLDTLENQIIHYKIRIKNAETELLELVYKSKKQNLNATEEEKLLELDTFIEKSIDQRSSIPEHLKCTKNLDKLHKMIDNTDKLLEKLKNIK